VFIEKFDLGIGEEWLPHAGLADDGMLIAVTN